MAALDSSISPRDANPAERQIQRQKRRAWIAIAALFLSNGFTLASWISRIPAVTGALDLSPGQIGGVLMTLAAGAIVAFPLAGRLIDTRSSAVATTLFNLILILALPFVGLASSLPLLMAALLIFGFGNGGMDVSMNAQGIEVERAVGGSIINSLHGFFSLGAFAGAAAGAGAAQLGIAPWQHFLAVSIAGLIVLGTVRGWLLVAPETNKNTKRQASAGPALRLPPRALWALGLLALAASVSEGAIADWSGLYLHEHLGTSSGVAALGYAIFSVCMLAGRFSGDALVRRFGAPTLVRNGAVLATVGLGVGVAIDQPPAMLVGFGAVGLGLSVVYPLVFSAAGNHPSIPSGQAVASVASIGYGGFLAGPPLLGWLAQLTSLRVVMALIVVLAAMIVFLAGATRTARTHR